jgi:hypothetical protein
LTVLSKRVEIFFASITARILQSKTVRLTVVKNVFASLSTFSQLSRKYHSDVVAKPYYDLMNRPPLAPFCFSIIVK